MIAAVNANSLKIKLLWIVVVLSLTGLGPYYAYGQDSNPYGTNGTGQGENGARFLRIKNENNLLTLRTEYEREKQFLVDSPAPSKRSRLLFEEVLETGFRGSVYHPKFMDFDIALGIAPQQIKQKSESGSGDDRFRNSYLTHYRVNSYFLKEKPLNFSLFTDKQREIQNRDFFERQIVDSNTYGGRFAFKNEKIPLGFSYHYSEKNIDRSFRGDQIFDDEIISLQVKPEFIPWGETDMDYTKNKFFRQEAGSDDQKGVSDQVSVSNRYQWDEAHPKNLGTYLRYFSLDDTRDSRDLTLNESLTVEHSDRLQSFYQYNLAENSVDNSDSTQHDITLGLGHQLYESLHSSVSINGISLKTTSFDESRAGVSIDEDYHKKIGLAQFGAGIGYAYERRNRDAAATFLNIANESHALLDSAVVFLNYLDIDTSTIVVTNSAGTLSYIRDLDYQIIEHLSGFFEIRRITTGSISNGDQVLVDYIAQQNPSFGFSTAQNRYRLSLGFWENKLQFYSRYRQQQPSGFKGESNLVLEEFNDKVSGCQLNLDGMNVSAEYEDYVSDLSPYTALRFREDLTWNISPRSLLTLHSGQDYVNLLDDKRDSYDVRGRYSLRLSRLAVCSLENGYRRQKGKNTDLENFTSRMTYRINVSDLSLETGYEFQKEYSLGNDRDNHYFFSTLKRRF